MRAMASTLTELQNKQFNFDPYSITNTNDLTHRQSTFHNYQLKTCTTREELFSLRNVWSDLAEKSGQSIYMSPDWIITWWDHFGVNKDRQLHIITISDQDRIIGILPFYKGVSKFGRTVVEQRLQLIGSGGNSNERFGFLDDYGISDFLDFIIDPDFNEPVAKMIASLLQTPEFASFRIILHQLREDSFIIRQLLPKLKLAERSIEFTKTDTCPYIDLTDTSSLDSYIKEQKSNARRRLRQARSGSETHYRIEEAGSTEELEIMLEDLIRLHQERWNQIGYPGVFHNHRFKTFFTDIMHLLHSKQMVWFRQALDPYGVNASRMAILYNNRYFDYMSGFDSNSPTVKSRPGIGLLLNLVEHSLTHSVERIELLRGEETYKYDFTQKSLENWKISIPPDPSCSRTLRVLVPVLYVIATIYAYSQREFTLLNIQYRKSGFTGMLRDHFKFRLQTVRNKFQEGNLL